LKENVILGHLVPAGTGFRTHQEAEVRLTPHAVDGAAAAEVEADEAMVQEEEAATK
jgi:DNA-directed RNA polymerase subunit beta'